MKVSGIKHKAFSLIEMSVVVLIISVLTVGVMESRKIVARAKIANARSLTANSPVASLEELMLWYESTSEQSFDKEEALDGKLVSTWYDLNPRIKTVRNNATQTLDLNKPTYKINKINGLPAISFNKSGPSYMLFTDESPIVNSEYTIFIVGQRNDNQVNDFIGSNTTILNSNLRVGYRTDTSIQIVQWGNGLEAICSSYTTPSPVIFSANFNFNAKNLYMNGALQTTTAIGSVPDSTTPLIEYDGAGLGASSNHLKGDIGEVIIFKKYLNTEERKSVENYLGKKWGIEMVAN